MKLECNVVKFAALKSKPKAASVWNEALRRSLGVCAMVKYFNRQSNYQHHERLLEYRVNLLNVQGEPDGDKKRN